MVNHALVNSVLDVRLTERVILGTLVTVLVLVLVAITGYSKQHNKQRMWFKPIGLSGPMYKHTWSLKNSDYVAWATIAGIFLIYWFASYWVVNLIQLAEFNQAFQEAASHGGIKYVWDPQKVIANGDIGGWNAVYADGHALPNGSSTLMPLVMKQTNVTISLFNILDRTANQTNLENNASPFFEWPVPNDPFLLKISNNVHLNPNPGTGELEINTFLNALDPENQTFAFSIMSQWLRSFVYSNIFVTPLCQFMSFAFPASIIMSYKRDYASMFAPWAFLGGLVTIYGGVVADDNVHVTWQFVFYDQQLFFGYHAFLLTAGLCWLVYSNRYSFQRVMYTFALIASYVVWVVITTRVLKIDYYTTGLTELDFAHSGSYEIVPVILANTNIGFPLNSALMIIVFVSVVIMTLSIKNLIHYKYWKKHNINYSDSFFNDIKLLSKKTINYLKKH